MSGLADSGLVLRLTRSRAWIGVLGTLLVGIVALNVMALSLNTSSSKTAGTSEEILRENSALRADIADGLSNERLQSVAVRLGLVMPEAAATLVLVPGPGDAATAAKRLRKGKITVGSAYVPEAVAAPVTPAIEPAAPVATSPVDPAAGVAPVAPVPTAPAPVAPAAAAAPTPATPPGSAGGIVP